MRPNSPPAVVVQAELSEEQIIEAARQAVEGYAYTVGRLACEWTARYARGRTDADFGELIGMDGGEVRQRRAVWDRFGSFIHVYESLSWSHFRAALGWDDAKEALEVASYNCMSVREMTAWHNLNKSGDAVAVEVEPKSEPEPQKPGSDGKVRHGSNFDTNEIERAIDHDKKRKEPAKTENPPEKQREKPQAKPPVDVDSVFEKLSNLIAEICERNLDEERQRLADQLERLAKQLRDGHGT